MKSSTAAAAMDGSAISSTIDGTNDHSGLSYSIRRSMQTFNNNNNNHSKTGALQRNESKSCMSDLDDTQTDDCCTIASTDSADNKHNNNPALMLAGKETQAVRRFRILLFVVIFSLMVLASVGVYFYISSDQQSKFEVEFVSKGTKIISGFNDDSFRIMQSLEALSTSLTSRANGTWPFVTLGNSARILEPYLVANVASLVVMPIVGIRQRTAWEKYVRQEQHWVNHDLKERSNILAEQQHQLQQDDSPLSSTSSSSSLAKAELELGMEKEQEQQDSTADENDGNDGRRRRRLRYDRELQYFTEDNSLQYKVSSYIKNYVGIDVSKGPWVVWWQYAPVIPNRWFLNFNRLAFEGFKDEVQAVLNGQAVISKAWTYEPGLDFQSTRDFTFLQEMLKAGGNGRYQEGEPIGFIHYPVAKQFGGGIENNVAAVLTATIYWKTYFMGVVPNDTRGIICVVKNSQGQSFSYLVQGQEATFLGSGDHHDPVFDRLGLSADYSQLSITNSFDSSSSAAAAASVNADYTGRRVNDEYITYTIHVYPTHDMENQYVSSAPVIWLCCILAGFSVLITIFVVYDRRVERRQHVVWTSAVRSNNVVSDMFPAHLRQRVMDQEEELKRASRGSSRRSMRKSNLKQFLNDGDKDGQHQFQGLDDDLRHSKPLADLYLDTTVLVADIVGFTAWSSVREPHMVFSLLEHLYFAFDKVAKKRRVYKVESVGDQYIAVAGLPEPRRDHAVAMSRFGKEIISKMHVLTKGLEVELGPDTADLGLRIGMHSGPVTAGVLRGERARFQLFGDTMNTVGRLERYGQAGRIHCSKETAAFLMDQGKGGWLEKRLDCPGKGIKESYWVRVGSLNREGSVASIVTEQEEDLTADQKYGPWNPELDEKTNRLIDWNVEMLLRLLKQIVARRDLQERRSKFKRENSDLDFDYMFMSTPLEEVREIIALPDFSIGVPQDMDEIEIPNGIVQQLHQVVTAIACLYNKNPFHNFDHASHVVQSVTKLLSRIVAAPDVGEQQMDDTDHAAARHDHTYGITSDPLTQFACAFSALIHDADHQGVSNAQLVKEDADVAKKYGRSVAEQNSLDLAWNILMDPSYTSLQSFLFPTHAELSRFRQLVVNSVMATDIVDADLKALRNGRWDKAFKLGASVDHFDKNKRDEVNRKATIVIEHIIQASDISHTMQHWNVYLKWNQALFEELYVAYLHGRMDKDPATFWYKGEFGFFDFYIIPLTKKLKDCGVFGVSSDEYLNYAKKNRENWEMQGEEVVEGFIKQAREKFGVKKDDNGDSIHVPTTMLKDDPATSSSSGSSSEEGGSSTTSFCFSKGMMMNITDETEC